MTPVRGRGGCGTGKPRRTVKTGQLGSPENRPVVMQIADVCAVSVVADGESAMTGFD